MLRIMLVDDEFYFREALKLSIPWEELGFKICAEAKNGEDAMIKLKELNPDIAIVDINMPVMDGLEFAQSVRDKGVNLKMIILTGYNDFSYAKQAVWLGVHNYLLKPVDEEELKRNLLEIKTSIRNERNIGLEIEMLKKKLAENMPVLRDRMLNDLLQGSISYDESELLKKIEYLDLKLTSSCYQVIAIEFDDKKVNLCQEERQLWKFAVSNITEELLMDVFPHEICYAVNDKIFIIAALEENENENSKIVTICERIREAVNTYLKISITIGIGNSYKDLKDIQTSYREAVFALKNRIVLGEDGVILYSMVAECGMMRNFYSIEQRRHLLISMRLANFEEANRLVRVIFKELGEKNKNPELVFVTCIELISTCFELLGESGQNISGVFKNSLNLIDELESKKSLKKIEDWICHIVDRTIEYYNRNNTTKSARIVEEAKKCISNNYCNSEFKIDDIAKVIFVNYSHLCFVFKKFTGVTINDYLTELRISKAKELFDNGNQLIQAVAEKVGYADANYFSKCFKKYYGVTPSRYLESINNG